MHARRVVKLFPELVKSVVRVKTLDMGLRR